MRLLSTLLLLPLLACNRAGPITQWCLEDAALSDNVCSTSLDQGGFPPLAGRKRRFRVAHQPAPFDRVFAFNREGTLVMVEYVRGTPKSWRYGRFIRWNPLDCAFPQGPADDGSLPHCAPDEDGAEGDSGDTAWWEGLFDDA